MNKSTGSLNTRKTAIIKEKTIVDKSIKNTNTMTFQQRLASISKKLNLCLLVNYK
ncbi:MAG: hypothetical protein HRT54_20485 [Colwellia sp.]|nr:hypothetical protein [Colwellia sp.]